jgi:RND family efflux transporter MFP subunit
MKKLSLKIFKNKKFYFIFIFLLISSYFLYSKIYKKENSKYILSKVERGNIEVKISGSGEIIPVEEIETRAKTGGEVLYVNVREGEEVKEGQILAQLESKNIEKAIKDQEILIKNLEVSIESLKLNLEKLNFQYQNTLRGDDYNKALNQGILALNDFYNFYPNFIEDIRKIYFYKDFQDYNNNLEYYQSYNPLFAGKSQKLELAYNNLKSRYLQLSDNFKNILEDSQTKEKIIENSYNLVLDSYDLVNEGKEILRYIKEDLVLKNAIHEKQDIIENHFQKLSNYLNSLGQYKQNLFEIISKINSYKDIVNNYDFDKKNLELSIKQKELDLEQAKKKLEDLRDDLNDYYIIAPLSGILSKFKIKKGDLVVVNQSVGTIITNQKIAKISLNEVDVAKVKIGHKVILTFDAFPDLKLEGRVFEISPVGVEDQGVVSYDVKISIGKENKEIKPGMSVNGEIIIDKKDNVLLIPTSAVKSDKKGEYVLVIKNFNTQEKEIEKPIQISQELIDKKYIKTGISNDEFVEVLEGLSEGEIFIFKVINEKIPQNKQQTNPFLPRMPFGGRK